MRILITGASGMLGAALVKFFSNDFEVFGTGNSDFNEAPSNYKIFDLLNDSYDELIEWSNPDLIIHSGALTNGNFCDVNPSLAFDINGVSVKKILDATESRVKIIYISTDAVFPSSLHLAKEKDFVFPENIYGKSKEIGEFFLLNSDRNYTIVRTTIVGLNENKNKSGFVEWILNASKSNQEITLFDDVLFNPISIWELAEELLFLINSNTKSSETLHIAGAQVCTKYEFGKLLLEEFNFSTDYMQKGSISMFKNRAKRCTDQTLDSKFYQKKYNRNLPSLLGTIKTLKKNYNE
jgi:dTDP-4-dehydrorhamnose reductase